MLFSKTGIKFCPKCRSTRIGVRYLDPFSLQPKYLCRSCGFSSFMVPETEREIGSIKFPAACKTR